MGQNLKVFTNNKDANVRVKTSESINVHDSEGMFNRKRLLVIGGGMTAQGSAVENSKGKSVTLLHRKNFKRREFDVEPDISARKG